MSDIISIKKKLKRLRITNMGILLEERLKDAIENKWSYSSFIDFLLDDEIEQRNHKMQARRTSKSNLDLQKSLKTFDFSFNKKINEIIINELASCNFITKKENIFFLGPTGTGKSHLAQGIGLEACLKGHDVLFYRTQFLFQWVHQGRSDGSYKKRIDNVIKIPLLILDDFGLQSLTEDQQNDLFEVICNRYDKQSTIITSNRDVSEWPAIFKNPLLGSAAVDRLVHHAISVIIEGNSYRYDKFINSINVKNEKLI